MKNNLLKILVTMGVVLSLGACGKKPVQPSSQEPSSQEPSSQEPSSQETIEEVTLVELMEIDSEAEPDETGLYPFVLEGKKVVVKGVNIAGNYQNYYVGFFTNESGSATIADMRGFFFQITDEAATKPGKFDVADVTGTVRNWNGQILLENASVNVTNAAQWTEDGKLVSGTGSGGQWRWSLQRNYYDYLAGRALGNGAWVRGVVQLKTLPTDFSGNADSTFQIVFPGESMTNDDTDVTVRLPKNPGEDTFTRFKNFFQPEQGDAPEAGDFVLIGGLLSYNYEKEVLLDDWFGNVAVPDPADLPLIANTYKDMYDEYLAAGKVFIDARMNYGTALEEAGVFSYVIDEAKIGAKLTSIYNPASDPGYFYGDEGLLHMTNPEDFAYFNYVMNFELSDDENADHPVDVMLEALQAAHYEIGAIQFTGGEISFSATLYEHPATPASTSESGVPNARFFDGESSTTESVSEEEDPRGAVLSQVIINMSSETATQAEVEEIGLPLVYEGSVGTAIMSMYANNNATILAETDTATIIQSYTATSRVTTQITAQGVAQSGYVLVAGKQDYEDGLYSFVPSGELSGEPATKTVGEGSEAHEESTFKKAAAFKDETPGLDDYLYGTPTAIAGAFLGCATLNAKDTLAEFDAEDLADYKVDLAAYFKEQGATDEQAAAAATSYVGNMLKDLFTPTLYATSYCTEETFVGAEFALTNDNVYTVSVYFEFQGKTYYGAYDIGLVGKTANAIDTWVAALPAKAAA